jgi:hypothetical protein
MRLYAKFFFILTIAIAAQWLLTHHEPAVYELAFYARVYAASIAEDDAAYGRLVNEYTARLRAENGTAEMYEAYEEGLLPPLEQASRPPWRDGPRWVDQVDSGDALPETGACSGDATTSAGRPPESSP